MPYKFTPSDDELEATARELAALSKAGTTMLMWLRSNHRRLTALNEAGWSWRWVAEAMNRAKLTYKTGNHWTANRLRAHAHRAGQWAKSISITSVITSSHDSEPSVEGHTDKAPVGDAMDKPIGTEEARVASPPAVRKPEIAPQPLFLPMKKRAPQPPVAKTPEELARYEKVRARIFGSEN